MRRIWNTLKTKLLTYSIIQMTLSHSKCEKLKCFITKSLVTCNFKLLKQYYLEEPRRPENGISTFLRNAYKISNPRCRVPDDDSLSSHRRENLNCKESHN